MCAESADMPSPPNAMLRQPGRSMKSAMSADSRKHIPSAVRVLASTRRCSKSLSWRYPHSGWHHRCIGSTVAPILNTTRFGWRPNTHSMPSVQCAKIFPALVILAACSRHCTGSSVLGLDNWRNKLAGGTGAPDFLAVATGVAMDGVLAGTRMQFSVRTRMWRSSRGGISHAASGLIISSVSHSSDESWSASADMSDCVQNA